MYEAKYKGSKKEKTVRISSVPGDVSVTIPKDEWKEVDKATYLYLDQFHDIFTVRERSWTKGNMGSQFNRAIQDALYKPRPVSLKVDADGTPEGKKFVSKKGQKFQAEGWEPIDVIEEVEMGEDEVDDKSILEVYTKAEIGKMTVPQLRKSLTSVGITIPKGTKKKGLINLLEGMPKI